MDCCVGFAAIDFIASFFRGSTSMEHSKPYMTQVPDTCPPSHRQSDSTVTSLHTLRKFTMKLITTASLSACLSFSAMAQTSTAATPVSATTPVAQTTTQSTTPKDVTQAQVRKIDKEAKKITLKHGPIKNLDMPGMTMVFQVRDAALFDKLAVGDKIMFTAEQLQGAFVITGAEKVQAK
jgi:Cu(I)/Ag(I) efflux system periplasmic protein CusF